MDCQRERLSLDEVPLTAELRGQTDRWIAEYADSKLPWEPTHDDGWLVDGRRLFDDLRRELLGHGIDLQSSEDFWASEALALDAQPSDAGEH